MIILFYDFMIFSFQLKGNKSEHIRIIDYRVRVRKRGVTFF